MKKLAVFLLIALFTIPVFAQHTAVYVVDDFSKLLSSHVSPYIMPQNAAQTALNVRASNTLGSLSKRTDMDIYGTIGSIALTSLHRLYKADETAYLIATGSTNIYVGDDDAGTFSTISDNQTTGLRFDWITYKDNAIGCNGTDACVKYDGSTSILNNVTGNRTASNVVSELGAPYAQLLTGSNLDALKWYQYKIMFYDGTTNYYSSRASNPILTGSTVRNVTLTDIPLGKSGTTHRYIYRTEGQTTEANARAATFKLAITIANNTATTQADAIADGSLTTTWSTSGKTDISPKTAKVIQIHKERVFLANAPSLNSYIYWSNAFYPEWFDAADFDYVRVDDGDEITFMESVLRDLAIGKTNTIMTLDTQNADDTKWTMFASSFVGCPAPWSVAQTPEGVFYLGWDGIYMFNGQNSQLISEVVTPEINDILQSNLDEVAGIYANNEYNLAYTSIESGEYVNNRILVYDLVTDAYTIDTKDVNTFAYLNSGNDYGTLYYGSSNADGYVYAEATDTSALIFRYKSEFDAGTTDSIAVTGVENDPALELGWGVFINNTTSYFDTTSVDASTLSNIYINATTFDSSTINRPFTKGYWWSAATQVNANTYNKLYWNEELGANGDVTFAVRSSATSTMSGSFSSEFTDPSGSDISGETANDYIQLRAKLTTTDITTTPYVTVLDNFGIKMLYSRIGTAAETAINSLWESGFHDFGKPTIPKRIWGINVFYVGTLGILTVGIENERGDIDQSFDIDLSVDPTANDTDQYFGSNLNKIYKWLPPLNSETTPTPIGRKWKFDISEGGISSWNVYNMTVKFSEDSYYDD